MSQKVLLALAAVVTLAWPAVRADEETDKALGPLEAEVQNQPQSVQARLALAEACLRFGLLDKALAHYQAVLKLSPDHAQAKRMVEALTGQRKTFEQRLAFVQALMEVGAYPQAAESARALACGPYETGQRTAARLAAAEATLWSDYTPAALPEALQLAQDAKGAPAEAQARIIAALARIAGGTMEQHRTAVALVADLADLPAPWKQRAELVPLLVRLLAANAAETSARLPELLAAIPPGGYRVRLVDWLTNDMTLYANATSDLGRRLAILWSMLSSDPLPAKPADLVGKPVALKGGWVLTQTDQTQHDRLVGALVGLARAEWAAAGADAPLTGFWLACEHLRQMPPNLRSPFALDRRLQLLDELAALSRPAPGRRKGDPLCPADTLQARIVAAIAGELATEDQRQRLVKALMAHVNRYRAANDLETGLAVIVPALKEAPVPAAAPVVGLALPPGPADRQLKEFAAAQLAILGQEAFAKAAAGTAPDANAQPTGGDSAAIALYAGLLSLYPDAAQTVLPAAEGVINRYARADRWAAAAALTGLLWERCKGDSGRWATARLKIAQAVSEEDKQLAARHKLPDALNPLFVEALAAARDIVQADPTDLNRNQAAMLAGQRIVRYERLDRPDLAEAVIELMAPKGVGELADWALLNRAGLLERQAAAPLALAAKQFDGVKKLTLNESHAAALKLLGEFVEKFPASRHAPAAIAAVERLGGVYQNYKAFDVAAAVLADFVKAHPKIAQAERLEYAAVAVGLAKANATFAERQDKAKPPAKLSDEFAAAADGLAAFLKARPTGPYSAAAENELINVARTYGQVGAWEVARDLLKRFAAAVPDFREPARLQLLQAATYLGELDRDHGLALLTPPPPPPPVSGPEGRSAGLRPDRTLNALVLEDASIGYMSAEGDDKSSEARQPSPDRPAASAPPPAALRPPVVPEDYRPMDALGPTPAEKPLARQMDQADQIHDIPGQALAAIRQSEQQQSMRIAQLQGQRQQRGGQVSDPGSAIVLPAGPVLSEAEMKRQDAAADAAYAILIALVKQSPAGAPGPDRAGGPGENRAGGPAGSPAGSFALREQARGEILWLVGFFEGQLRANQAVALIERFIKDQPADPARVSLAYQAISDRLVWAAQRQGAEKIDQAWIDARHKLFEAARDALASFSKDYAKEKTWASRARLLAVSSYQREADLVAVVSAARAAGLLARAADELTALAVSEPEHPDVAGFPGRLWAIADRLTNLGQRDQALYVLSQIPIRFPTDPLAVQAVLRMAETYAAALSAPLRAVETYQEYLALAGDNESIRSQIFSIAQQLWARQRYLEALHVYGVFVESFPTDARAPAALQAIGQIHQANEAWTDAIAAYERVLKDYPAAAIVAQVKLAIADCDIQLSQWKAARKIYEEFAPGYASAQPPPQQGGQAGQALQRIEVLKTLDRYQTLLADPQVTRNRDDAQFQIGRTVLEKLGNRVKAIQEFAKVIKDFPKSEWADDAQFEIGKALLALGRLDEARAALLKVPADYPNSPMASDALLAVGQSYETQAQTLAGITLEKAREVAFVGGQRGAYQEFQKQQDINIREQAERRVQLKSAGKGKELELEEAYTQFRYNVLNDPGVRTLSRKAEQQAETESAMELANRQDRINEAYRSAVAAYGRAAREYPLGGATSNCLLRMAEIYETNLKDLKSAMSTYQDVVRRFPGTPVAENAAWKVAKFYEQENKFDEAVNAYREFIRTYPGSGRVADAQFAMAEALEQAGRWVEAMDAYQTFRDKFASHPKATAAGEQIQWIKAYRK